MTQVRRWEAVDHCRIGRRAAPGDEGSESGAGLGTQHEGHLNGCQQVRPWALWASASEEGGPQGGQGGLDQAGEKGLDLEGGPDTASG